MAKRIVSGILCFLILACVVGCSTGSSDSTREAYGYIQSVGEYTTIETTDGNQWLLTDFPCEEGISCTVVFATNGTEIVQDDVILQVELAD